MGSWNTFVEGDNLDVLPRLRPEFGAVDLVYIDPPYNTGNDFAYRDDFRDGGARGSRHTAWVAMMRPRLEAARELMSPRSAIWVSIDDNEAAYLRLLMDEVFGEPNFLAQVVVNLNPKGRQLGNGFATSHEYLLVYARDRDTCALDPSSADAVDHRDFPLEDPGDPRRYRRLPLRNTNKKFNPVTAPTMHYPLFGDPDTGEVRTDDVRRARSRCCPVFGDGTPAVWRWSAPLVDAAARRPGLPAGQGPRRRAGRRVPEGLAAPRRPRRRPGGRRKKLRTIWLAEEVGSTDTAVAELKDDRRPRLRVAEADRPGPADPGDHARRRARPRLLRRQRHHRARGRARQRRRRRHPALRQRELRRADPRGLQRPQRRAGHRRRHHPGPAARGRRAGRWRARRAIAGSQGARPAASASDRSAPSCLARSNSGPSAARISDSYSSR